MLVLRLRGQSTSNGTELCLGYARPRGRKVCSAAAVGAAVGDI